MFNAFNARNSPFYHVLCHGKLLQHNFNNPLCRPAIPQLGRFSSLSARSEDFHRTIDDALGGGPYQLVCAFRDGYGPLRVIPQGEARYPKECCFLLDAPRIGEDHPGRLHDGHGVDIAQRVRNDEILHLLHNPHEVVFCQCIPRSGMKWPEELYALLDTPNCTADSSQC